MTFNPRLKKREVLSLHIPIELSKRINKAVERTGLTKQELIRQMIQYSLDQIKFEPKEERTVYNEQF